MSTEIIWPEIADYNWGEKLLVGLELLTQNGQVETHEITSAKTTLAGLHSAILLTGDRQTLSEIDFLYPDRVRIVQNNTGSTVLIDETQIALGATTIFLPLGEGKYSALPIGAQQCEPTEFVVHTTNGVTTEWQDGELHVGIDFSNLTKTDTDALRERLLED